MIGIPNTIMAAHARPDERRVYRQPIPTCEQCASTNVRVVTRVERFLYLRCEDCWHPWSVPKAVPALTGRPKSGREPVGS